MGNTVVIIIFLYSFLFSKLTLIIYNQIHIYYYIIILLHKFRDYNYTLKEKSLQKYRKSCEKNKIKIK